MMELKGLKVVDGEDPPRILHFNPRLYGDWSQESVIEVNTCYRMQWGIPLRCDGTRSGEEEETGRLVSLPNSAKSSNLLSYDLMGENFSLPVRIFTRDLFLQLTAR